MKKRFLETGKITGTHGVRGMVRIQPWCDSFEFLCSFKKFYLDTNGTISLNCEKIQPNGNVAIAKFKEINTIEDAEKFRNKIIYIDRSDAKIEEGSYFIQDLIGCRVNDADTGKNYGVISEVSSTGANDVWHIKNADKEYLIPVIDEIVKEVDVENENVLITPLKGIFDDED